MPSGQTPQIKSTLARNIRLARDERELTQKELGRLVNDVGEMQISRWERGEHRPSDTNMQALVDVLEHDLAWFYTEHESAAA